MSQKSENTNRNEKPNQVNYMEPLINGLIKENPTFILMLGLCPTLAVTTSASNAIGMGLSSTAVLVMSNLLISLLRNIIPDKVRMPSYIVIVASFVTIVQFLLQGFVPAVYDSLGIYIPLIVVNCIILARAESFASKNGVVDSIIDGLGMGVGYTIAMVVLSSVREILGNGTLLGINILPEAYEPMMIMVQPPGSFIALGLLIGLVNYLSRRKKA